MWLPNSRTEYLAYLRGSAVVLAILLGADWLWRGFGLSELWCLWILAALAAPFLAMNFLAPD
jgi:hypothetical protein